MGAFMYLVYIYLWGRLVLLGPFCRSPVCKKLLELKVLVWRLNENVMNPV